MQKRLVIKKHISNYPKPIVLKKGDKVMVGETYDGEEDWHQWRLCTKVDRSNAGWVPEQLIDMKNGTMKQEHTAQELSVDVGEQLTGIKRMNGWVWDSDNHGNEGCVPEMNLNMAPDTE